MPAGAIGGIDDATLLQTPPESVKSSEDNFSGME